MLSHKASINEFKKFEIILGIFSDHKGYEARNELQEEN